VSLETLLDKPEAFEEWTEHGFLLAHVQALSHEPSHDDEEQTDQEDAAWPQFISDYTVFIGHADWRRHPVRSDAEVEALFDVLKIEWKDACRYISSIEKIAIHPAYQRIIGLGLQAVPLILEDLRQEPDQWFWALSSIAGEDIGADQETATGAAEAWLLWGREQGFIN
jgi:hypothetical protein